MVESTLPSLRRALSQAWRGLRSAFGLFAPPPQTPPCDVEAFIARLEQVLAHELAPVTPPPDPWLLLEGSTGTATHVAIRLPAPAPVMESATEPEAFPEYSFSTAMVAPRLPVFDPVSYTVPEPAAPFIHSPVIESSSAPEADPAFEIGLAMATPPLPVFDQIPDAVYKPAVQFPQTASVESLPSPKRKRKSSSEHAAKPAAKRTRSKKPVTNPVTASANDTGPSAPRKARNSAARPAANSTSPLDSITAVATLQNGAPKPASGRKRQAPAPRATLESTAMVHDPQVKFAAAGYASRARVSRMDQPLPDLYGAEQTAIPLYQHAPEQIQAQALAGQVPPKQKKNDGNADSSPFSVSVGEVYDGPLDLLLDLIRRQDIDIYDIPIATITAQFLSYVNQLKATDVDVAGEFIYTASLLIHIKSKMLLPRSPAGPDEAPEDPRRELVERLLEHERFKNAAQMLQQKQMLEAATWSNPGFREFQDDVAAEPEIAADTTDLVRIFRDILERARKRPVLDLQEDSATVGQMIQFLARRLSIEDKPVALRRLLSGTRSEKALVAIFLALLELVRLQAILLRQDRAFSEIFIKKSTGFDAVMNEGLANAQDDWR